MSRQQSPHIVLSSNHDKAHIVRLTQTADTQYPTCPKPSNAHLGSISILLQTYPIMASTELNAVDAMIGPVLAKHKVNQLNVRQVQEHTQGHALPILR